nr:elongation of very long chain fatty acids protein-like [Procambarus clarkii]
MTPTPNVRKSSHGDLNFGRESFQQRPVNFEGHEGPLRTGFEGHEKIPEGYQKSEPSSRITEPSSQRVPNGLSAGLDFRQRPSGITDQEEQEGKLWSNGCGAAAATTFLYIYGNLLVMDQMPVDPRVQSWAFVSSPTPILAISLAYIAAVTWLGPRLMRHREPFRSLKPVMIVYNAFQVVFSAWIFYEAGMGGWFGSYNILCQPCDFSDSPQAIRMVHAAFWYNFSKFVDFIDTIFFILNKKYGHISLLHVSHHALMPIGVWYGVRHEPGGQTTFFGFLNCFVHVVMYSYYLLAAMGPRVRPFLWWKKYLTTLQMVQFVMMFTHAALTIVTGCPVGIPLMRVILGLAVIFLILFLDFYIKAYRHKAKRKAQGSLTCIPKLSSVYGEREDQRLVGHINDSIEISNAAVFNKSFAFQTTAGDTDQHNVRSRQHAD